MKDPGQEDLTRVLRKLAALTDKESQRVLAGQSTPRRMADMRNVSNLMSDFLWSTAYLGELRSPNRHFFGIYGGRARAIDPRPFSAAGGEAS